MKPRKVLIVDDEDTLRKYQRIILSSYGCQVLEADNAVTAWEIFQKERPDACCIDIYMPESAYNGLELLRKIRDIDKDVLCVVLTAGDDVELKDEIIKRGALYYHKGIDCDKFYALIDKLAGVDKNKRSGDL